ncbi:MAG: hypothetical protein QOJ23_4850 [Actinomycetota bacterium]|jgi:hypothetical protein|nr:hypothetical protein [Actinomycetota bacterium]
MTLGDGAAPNRIELAGRWDLTVPALCPGLQNHDVVGGWPAIGSERWTVGDEHLDGSDSAEVVEHGQGLHRSGFRPPAALGARAPLGPDRLGTAAAHFRR